MDIRDLTKIDLNLLIALEVLLEEGSVSRAAERLFITQPAMSKTLSRLRAVFDDPLFIRTSHGMQATPRAEALNSQLGSILGDINRLVAPADFDPGAYTGEITLALSEYIGVTLLPPLIARLHKMAPHMALRCITRVENQLEQLSHGKLDFSIHIEQGHYTEDFKVQPITRNPPTIMVRAGHPLCEGEVSWNRLANYPVIRLYMSDLEQVELAKASDTFRRVRSPDQGSLETSHLLTSLEVLRTTDYFMPGPAYILQNKAVTQGIVGLPLPPGGNYTLNYMLVTHRRTDASPAHQWFWQQIVATLNETRAQQDAPSD